MGKTQIYQKYSAVNEPEGTAQERSSRETIKTLKKSELTKARILKAAQDEFAAKGFYGARIDSIVQKAGINKERIYAYFKSKDNLFTEVLDYTFKVVMEDERIFFNLGESDIPNLEAIILNNFFSVFDKYPCYWRLIAWANLERGKESRIIRNVKSPAFTHLESLYKKGQDRGMFDKEVPFKSFMFLLLGISYFYNSNRGTMSKALDLDLGDENIKRTIIQDSLKLISAKKGKEAD